MATRCPERDLISALITARILDPRSKLATARGLEEETASSSLAEVLHLTSTTADDLYEAMDWLLPRQQRIEQALARRHLSDGCLVLYDVTSTYFEGHHCPLARFGHSRDERSGNPQVGYLLDSGSPNILLIADGSSPRKRLPETTPPPLLGQAGGVAGQLRRFWGRQSSRGADGPIQPPVRLPGCPIGSPTTTTHGGYLSQADTPHPQIVCGLLTNAAGCPVAVEVFPGNTADPNTVAAQVVKLRQRFGLQRLVLVGDCGMLTSARIREDLQPVAGIEWITALRAPAIKKLV